MTDSGSENPSPSDGFELHPAFMLAPEEVQAMIRQQMETSNALSESNVRRQDAFIESLDEDQLRMLRGFIKSTISSESFGNYMVGWISALLKIRYKVCQFCGDKHESLEDMLTAHPGTEGSAK